MAWFPTVNCQARQARQPNQSRSRLVLFALCCLAAFLTTPGAARASTDPDKSTFDITFDDTAVRDLIAMVRAKDTSDTSIDQWLNLPANKYILSVGDTEHNLTRAQFRKNLIDEINGDATPQSQPLDDIGCLWMSSPQDFTAMLDAFDRTTPERLAAIVNRLTAFAPRGTHIKETVYFHLGGDWDAINDHGTIYVNLRYWHDLHRPSWDGINMIIAHETMHSVQNVAYGNPEYQSSSTPAFLTMLSKIQREGTARYVEYDTDPGPYLPSTYGFYYRAITTESYRGFPYDIKLLENVYKDCYPEFDHDKFGADYEMGMSDGGPYYDIGYGIAKAIDEHLGRPALLETVTHGPKLYFTLYYTICASDPLLPKLPGDVIRAVDAMPEKIDAASVDGGSSAAMPGKNR